MGKLTIHTNNVPRDILYAWDLTDKEREFWEVPEDSDWEFVRYKGKVTPLDDFVTTVPGPWNHGIPEEFQAWDGYASDSFFSGVLVRYVDDYERVVVGWYCS